MVAILKQAERSNFTNFDFSFYFRGIRYTCTMANNTSNEFSTSSRAAQRDSASQYLSKVLVGTNVLNQSVTAPTQRLISIYNFGAVIPSRETLSCPPPCFLLSEQTKRYTISVVPEKKKTDAEFVHQLLTVEASLKIMHLASAKAIW